MLMILIHRVNFLGIKYYKLVCGCWHNLSNVTLRCKLMQLFLPNEILVYSLACELMYIEENTMYSTCEMLLNWTISARAVVAVEHPHPNTPRIGGLFGEMRLKYCSKVVALSHLKNERKNYSSLSIVLYWLRSRRQPCISLQLYTIILTSPIC